MDFSYVVLSLPRHDLLLCTCAPCKLTWELYSQPLTLGQPENCGEAQRRVHPERVGFS